ncbi:hypothetical protein YASMINEVIRUS_964 [Yasminevirus sp. GU-2018]|uniref:Uncharacterized protein n=1 Tax=Yasminevirus sp. GU-2018 TaxID=2420051 RepID=A0A5K0UA75_9VIRU|nr:hypothetical protein YASMINEVIRUS_964 [Yasminevirus sp. GU-2018]
MYALNLRRVNFEHYSCLFFYERLTYIKVTDRVNTQSTDNMRRLVLQTMISPLDETASFGSLHMVNNENDVVPSDTKDTGILNSTNPTDTVQMPRSDEYDTGDILLFSDKTFIPSRLIEWFTDSKYSHAGIILRDPVYINPEMKGLYLFESTGLTDIVDCEDNKLKTGVQIRKLEDVYKEYNGAVFWRKLHVDRNEKFYQTIADVHKTLHNKPYDTNPKDWIESLLDVTVGSAQLTSRFFCSAMVTYVYDKLGLVDKGTPWTIIRPKDLGTENEATNRVKIINCTLDKEFVIKGYDAYVHYIYSTY